MRSLVQALEDFGKDSQVQGIISLMVGQSFERKEREPIPGDGLISQDEARKALTLQDMMRVHIETYYPEFLDQK